MENYPGNSDRSKKEPERKKLEKVVSGEVKAKKGLSESFISGTPRNVVSNLLTDVLIPAAKKTIVDMVNNGISMLLYGETGRVNKSSNPVSRISYRDYYDNPRQRSEPARTSRSAYDIEQIIFPTRGDAEATLAAMEDIIDLYDEVTLEAFYELVGKPELIRHTDCKYGLRDLSMAYSDVTRDGYILRLPRMKPLDR